MAELTANHDATPHHQDATPHQLDEQTKEHNENLKLGVWLYLASEVVIFSILIAGYVIFRLNQGEATNIVQEHLGILLVSTNTFVLLASSYAMVMGLRAIETGNKSGFMRWIGLTAVLGTVFLGGQYIEYSELGHLQIALQQSATTAESELFEGLEIFEQTEFESPEEEAAVLAEREALVNAAGNFGMRFYAPTAFHGAHVFVGVLWALYVLWRGWRGKYDYNAIGVELFGLYWHFVDVVWIVLFTLIYLI